MNEIKYVRLSKSQKTKAVKILYRGATLLKKWATFIHPKKFRQFRNDVMNGVFVPQSVIPKDRLQEFYSDLPHILEIRKPFDEFEGKTVEEAVLANFVALIKLHVRQWNNDDSNHNDYMQEGYMIILEAMYHYTREDVDITTFFWRVLRNRMINVSNGDNLLKPLTNDDLKLVIKYNKEKSNGGTFDEIVQNLGLSSEEGLYLGSILTKAFPETKLESEEFEPANDYTSYRIGIDNLSPMLRTNLVQDDDGEVVVDSVIDVEWQEHMERLFKKAKLNQMERLVLEAAMNPYHGWQTEFANQHCNPDTGKPYSRMRITQVLKKARSKMANVINEAEVEAA